MFGVGALELAVIATIAVIVSGPDKLPHLARQAGRMVRQLRTLRQRAMVELETELGADFDRRLLDPQTALREAIEN